MPAAQDGAAAVCSGPSPWIRLGRLGDTAPAICVDSELHLTLTLSPAICHTQSPAHATAVPPLDVDTHTTAGWALTITSPRRSARPQDRVLAHAWPPMALSATPSQAAVTVPTSCRSPLVPNSHGETEQGRGLWSRGGRSTKAAHE